MGNINGDFIKVDLISLEKAIGETNSYIKDIKEKLHIANNDVSAMISYKHWAGPDADAFKRQWDNYHNTCNKCLSDYEDFSKSLETALKTYKKVQTTVAERAAQWLK